MNSMKLSILIKKYPDIISVIDEYEGDRWYSEEETTYKFQIIYTKITEDDTDWGQAEARTYDGYKLNDENITKIEASKFFDKLDKLLW